MTSNFCPFLPGPNKPIWPAPCLTRRIVCLSLRTSLRAEKKEISHEDTKVGEKGTQKLAAQKGGRGKDNFTRRHGGRGGRVQDDIIGVIVDAAIKIYMEIGRGIRLSIPSEFRDFLSASPRLRVNQ